MVDGGELLSSRDERASLSSGTSSEVPSPTRRRFLLVSARKALRRQPAICSDDTQPSFDYIFKFCDSRDPPHDVILKNGGTAGMPSYLWLSSRKPLCAVGANDGAVEGCGYSHVLPLATCLLPSLAVSSSKYGSHR